MRRFAAALGLLSLLLSACAAVGSSRYGCQVKEGYSCKSVSRVYAETTSGGAAAALFPGKRACAPSERRFLKGGALRAGKITCERGSGEAAPKEEETMPVYVPPRAIRLFIAPWQDSRGVFHSGKHVYVHPGGGRWMIGGETVPLGGPPQGHPEEIPLLGAGEAP